MTEERVESGGHQSQDRSRTVNIGFAVVEQILGGVGVALAAVVLTDDRPAVSIGSIDAGPVRDLR